jgi:hypothetical protein
VRAAPTEDMQAELNHRRAGEDAPVSMEKSNDLWAKLNHRRAGEDARISLERARERRQNVEGCNLGYDFAAVAPCWNLLSAARKPTRVNGGDNRVMCTGAIALLI